MTPIDAGPSGRLFVCALTNSDLDRAAFLMETYSDLPCDFADATLIVAAEQLEATRIFTLDRHFYACRPRRGAPFEIFPGPLPR